MRRRFKIKFDETWRLNGVRGHYLIAKALFCIIIGLSYIVPTEPSTGTDDSLGFLLQVPFISVHLLGFFWVLGGVTAMVGAFRSPPGRDGWAFAVLIAMSTLWTIVFFGSQIQGFAARSFYIGFAFAALSFATYCVSALVPISYVEKAVEKAVKEALEEERRGRA